MDVMGVIQWEVSGWRFDVAAVHGHQAGSLGEEMRVVADSALELEAGEDVEVQDLPCHRHLAMFVASVVLA